MNTLPRGTRPEPGPAAAVRFEPRFCANHVVDLTAGCSFNCIYCPFSEIAARAAGVDRSTAIDPSSIAALEAPRSVFLSPASDAFAPQAASRTQALLARWLPQGTIVGIVTKGIIPARTLDLLERHRDQIEGIAIGLSNLDDRRNRILERGAPSATKRLEVLAAAAARRLPVALRMDPLFPDLDDGPAALSELVETAAAAGAQAITATYAFAWGRVLRRLRRESFLATSVGQLSEKARMEGGSAFSVPFARKLATYTLLSDLAERAGMRFNTCGCKDLRLREVPTLSTVCRNVPFLEQHRP